MSTPEAKPAETTLDFSSLGALRLQVGKYDVHKLLGKGADLSKHTSPQTLLPVPDVLQIGFKCCGALEYAAKEGIVHRDIKPANIMLAGGTEVKIADFGAAFLKKSQVVQTSALGSPYYMSPEQIEGSRQLTFHSDMYSLGVVLYELLTGKKPFLGANLEDLTSRILKFDPVPPSAVRSE